MENASSSCNMAPFSNFVWPIVTTADGQRLKSSPDSEKKTKPSYCLDCKTVGFFFSKSLKKLASHADVHKDSSRVPAPRTSNIRGAGTRDETLRTSAWDAIKKWVCGVSLSRAKRASCVAVYPQSHSPFSASFQTFCLTARTYLNTQKYGLFCSLLSVLPICSKQALILLIDDCFQNGNAQDPNCNGIHGVLAAYYHSIERVQLHGNISDLQGLLTPEYKRGGVTLVIRLP